MLYSLLADITMLLHFLFIAFALLGGFLVVRWKWVMWLHLPTALWAVGIEFLGGRCPLTPLENWFRLQAGTVDYEESFIQHYIGNLLYPQGLTPTINIILGVFVLVLNFSIYYWVYKQRRAH